MPLMATKRYIMKKILFLFILTFFTVAPSIYGTVNTKQQITNNRWIEQRIKLLNIAHSYEDALAFFSEIFQCIIQPSDDCCPCPISWRCIQQNKNPFLQNLNTLKTELLHSLIHQIGLLLPLNNPENKNKIEIIIKNTDQFYSNYKIQNILNEISSHALIQAKKTKSLNFDFSCALEKHWNEFCAIRKQFFNEEFSDVEFHILCLNLQFALLDKIIEAEEAHNIRK